MLDTCAQCISDWSAGKRHVDLWVGGNPQNPTVDAQAASITNQQTQIIVNPDPGKPVINGVIAGAAYESGCISTGAVSPPPAPPPSPPPAPPPSPPPAPPPSTGETTVNYSVDVYSQSENGGTATSSGQVAGGTGTYLDPITAAAGPGGPAQGALLYDSALQKYFVVEDTNGTLPLPSLQRRRALVRSGRLSPAVMDGLRMVAMRPSRILALRRGTRRHRGTARTPTLTRLRSRMPCSPRIPRGHASTSTA
jgi:hypothetical protein